MLCVFSSDLELHANLSDYRFYVFIYLSVELLRNTP